MVIPLLICAVLLQGTTGQQTSPAPPSPLLLKGTIHTFPRSQLQIKVSEPITVDLNQNTRAAYETLAELAGWNVIFDATFRDSFVPPIHLEKTEILDAFDRLSLATGNFVDVANSNTIIVAANNPTAWQHVEPQVLKTLYLRSAKDQQDLLAVVTRLRTFNFRYLAINTAAKAIIIKDTPERIAAAEEATASLFPIESSDPMAVGSLDTLWIQHGATTEQEKPGTEQLQVHVAGPISTNTNNDLRTTYETLAAKAGLNIIFDRDFRNSGPVALKFLNSDVLDAVDLLGRQTATFWEPLNKTTILISADNQTKRREYSQQIIETISLEDALTAQEMSELITGLRTILNMRYLAQVLTKNAIVMRDTPAQVALAEKILSDLGRIKPGPASRSMVASFPVGSESGGILKSRAVRSLLPDKFPIRSTLETVSIDVSDHAVDAFKKIAANAGLEVTFDKQFKDLLSERFALKDVPVLDALDFLAIQTGSFWVPVTDTQIFVTLDNQTMRQQVQPRANAVISLNTIQTPVGVTEVTVALRTLLNVRQVDGGPKGINIADSSDNVALAELLVANLDKQPQ